VHFDNELFHKEKIITEVHDPVVNVEYRDQQPVKFLYQRRLRVLNSGSSTYGFKIFFEHDKKVVSHVVNDQKWKVIVLERENKLDSFISFRIALRTKEWKSVSKAGESIPININVNEFLHYFYRSRGSYSELRRILAKKNSSFFDISYESVIDGDHDKLFDFVGCRKPDHLIRPAIVKQNSKLTKDKVINYEEVLDKLSGLGLGHLVVTE